MVKSQKGYSLIEIGVGILILTVFLICSVALFNGCYNTYRMIQQRNIATNYAVSEMEDLLQTDENILTGFFKESYDENSKKIKLVANPTFSDFVKNKLDKEDEYKERYNYLMKDSFISGDSVSAGKFDEYIYSDRVFLTGEYIKSVVESMNESEYNSEAVRNGNYALLAPSVTFVGSQVVVKSEVASGDNAVTEEYSMFHPVIASGDQVIIPDNKNNMIIKRTVTRLPIENQENAFGNQVLKLKVEVFFTNRVNNNGATAEDLRSVKIESVKVAGNS